MSLAEAQILNVLFNRIYIP